MCPHIQLFLREAQFMPVISSLVLVSVPLMLKSTLVWMTNYIVTLMLRVDSAEDEKTRVCKGTRNG